MHRFFFQILVFSVCQIVWIFPPAVTAGETPLVREGQYRASIDSLERVAKKIAAPLPSVGIPHDTVARVDTLTAAIARPLAVPVAQAAKPVAAVDTAHRVPLVAKHDTADIKKAQVSPTTRPPAVKAAGLSIGKRLVRWCRRHAGRMLVLAVCAAVVAVAVFQFIKRRDGERFLTATRLSVVDKEVQRACNYIEKNFADRQLSADAMCEALVTGRAFLEALFAQELGMKVEDFIVQVRVNRAKAFLAKHKDLSAAETADLVGFSDTEQFVKLFRTVAGVTLEEYKAAC